MKSNVSTKLIHVTCLDRVGVAADCFGAAGRSGLNVERLVGNKIDPYYVLTLLLSGPPDAHSRFERDELPWLSRVPASVIDVPASATPRSDRASRLLTVSVYAFDQDRMMADTTEVVRRHADLAGVAGSSYAAAESAAPLFLAELKAQLLPHAEQSELERDLERLADDRGWDIRVWPFEPIADHRRGFERSFPPSRGSIDLDTRRDCTHGA